MPFFDRKSMLRQSRAIIFQLYLNCCSAGLVGADMKKTFAHGPPVGDGPWCVLAAAISKGLHLRAILLYARAAEHHSEFARKNLPFLAGSRRIWSDWVSKRGEHITRLKSPRCGTIKLGSCKRRNR